MSGVLLLWLVYASGINGYMLPWDQLAQFTVVATAEWFDAIPIFNGLLIRNFLTVDSVNDRFFSLLSFLHIGLPLGRHGAAVDPHPPRPAGEDLAAAALMLGLGASMLALSIAKPALSQAPATSR